MAVKLRLRRIGKKKQPIYKVVAADSRSPRDGKFLEAIGLYNPLTDPSTIEIKEDRAMYWLNVGAQPTDTVKSLLSQKGIILKRELKHRGLTEEKIQEELDKWAKIKEAKVKSISSKKKTANEVVSQEKANKEVVENIEESTPEVKGAASENEATEKE
ncbi:MAG: 30S ribosomal protein S16 [Bacteroidetes bacterium]|nr:30S ribosomal protein S16 [Bacteroidota bacterium]